MYTLKMKYGRGTVDVSIPKKNLLKVIESNSSKEKSKTQEEVIIDALANPIASARLKQLVHQGEKVCVVISDVTRLWQKMSMYLPYIVEELNNGGVKDEDILFISATGSHREQTKEEHTLLLGEKLSERFEVINHNCHDEENLTYLGKTRFGTPVMVNKKALECDHIILTGAIVFHLLAGWGGGKKSVLPGICSYESIMKNHALSLSPNAGEGSNPLVKSGYTENNPLHQDMLEATSFVKPTFMFNVIMDKEGRISHAVAGNYIKAHEAGCKIVDQIDGVAIEEKADLVIATAGGYPKDINLYQTCKTVINAKEAVKKGGTMIILSQCTEGFGNDHVQEMIRNYDTVEERETALREDYSIAKYIGYFMSEVAQEFLFILVGDMDQKLVEKANMKVVSTIEKALEIAYEEKGKDLKTYLMPYGANTLPKFLK
ncbi:lactate racemase domain-containing protein [Marinisporobacter balticus]|uniref:Nickel-dependent lactate racemase n=1 Tax=Marinisporobacter balticus TaxID=2018667 RepID=A0A4R2KLP6_9FIRM|nr:nickel-dependent lactate racemase [Marinisporobacter balticus]TCO74603.1 nickel-dependent lactate racemase [Marinisporobacter balticus]